MTTEFQQKRGLNFRKFTLTSDKILVETRTLRKNHKYEIKLDRIGLDIHYQSDNTIAGKIFFGICIALVVGSVFSVFFTTGKDTNISIINAVLWTLMACFAYFKPHQDDIFLVGGQTNLVFYRDIPNEKVVLEFIDKVKENVKIYLKEKYTIFDSTTGEQDFYSRINWLRDREIISYSEYVEYKTQFDTQKLL
jgi:hypothetical protein